MTARLVGLVLGVFGATFAPALFGSSRAVVERIATIIDNNYFDAAKAHDIAAALRADAKAGRFDGLADPRDLTVALTTRLRRIDHHFNVTWSPRAGTPPASAADTAIPGMPSAILDRRRGYGFRSVEMLPGAIGYIDLRSFADFVFGKPDDPARKAADAALALVAGADAIIIDLRNNGGGLPAMVGYLVSAFTPPDADIYNVIHRRDGLESERPKEFYPKPRLEVPVYVLISGRTASAAEAAAYTLQAARRAVIVGEVSRGAANPGGEFPVGDGFSVFVSTGTPVNAVTGTSWEGVGVKPDVPVAAERALQRAQTLALEAVLAKDPNGTDAVDTRWTLEALRADSTSRSGPPLTDYLGTYADAKISTSNGHLTLQQGQRPAWILVRLHGDVFFVSDEPFRRVLFERDTVGRVKGFELLRSSGQAVWFRR